MTGLGRQRRARVLTALGYLAAGYAMLVPAASARPADGQVSRGGAVFSDAGLGGAGRSSADRMGTVSRNRNRPNYAFAGYLTTQSGSMTVKVRFKVPKFVCTKKERAISPGAFLLSGPSDSEVFSAANIILGCFKGHPVTEEVLVINNVERNAHRPLHAGDTVVARVTDRPAGSTTVEVQVTGKGHHFALRDTGMGTAPDAELLGDWASVDLSTGRPVLPPRFAPTTFRSGKVDGKPFGSLKPTGYRMVRPSHGLQISTGRFFGTPKDNFVCRRPR
ncbi:MAG: hypothetical protein ACJ764_00135 [Solirubrobacteraceae bacterium]